MKIKKFESFNTNEYYVQLSEDEYDKLVPEKDPNFKEEDYTMDFEDSEIIHIKKFLKGHEYEKRMGDVIHIYKNSTQLGGIIKLKDDWYILYILKFGNGAGQGRMEYYKCDRLDGLEKCFREKCK